MTGRKYDFIISILSFGSVLSSSLIDTELSGKLVDFKWIIKSLVAEESLIRRFSRVIDTSFNFLKLALKFSSSFSTCRESMYLWRKCTVPYFAVLMVLDVSPKATAKSLSLKVAVPIFFQSPSFWAVKTWLDIEIKDRNNKIFTLYVILYQI